MTPAIAQFFALPQPEKFSGLCGRHPPDADRARRVLDFPAIALRAAYGTVADRLRPELACLKKELPDLVEATRDGVSIRPDGRALTRIIARASTPMLRTTCVTVRHPETRLPKSSPFVTTGVARSLPCAPGGSQDG